MSATNYAGVNQRTNVYAAVEMLTHAQPQVVLGKIASTKPMPKNRAETMKFRRAVPFPRLTVALTEGVTPSSRVMQYEDVSVTMLEWGDVVECTDRVRELSEDPAIQDAATLLGEQAAETTEYIIWGVARAGSQQVLGNGTVRTDVNTAITQPKLHAMVRILNAMRGRFITEVQNGSVNYQTYPVEGGFVAVGHTDLEHDIRAVTNFIPVAKYGSRKVISEYELGSIENMRFLLTPVLEPFYAGGSGTLNSMKSVGGSKVDVYPLVLFAKEAIACVPLKGSKAVETFLLTGPDKSDPLNQRDLVGAKYWFNAVRLNETWMVRGEFGATAL